MMKLLLCTLAALSLLAACAGERQYAGVAPTCSPTAYERLCATPVSQPVGTVTVTREPATPPPATAAVVCYRDGSCLPAGSTATRVP